MRQVGTIATESDAQRFSDYLLTLGVSARLDAGASGHTVWVFEENDVERAKAAFDEFNRDPSQPKFAAAEQAAEKIRQEKIASRRQPQSNVIDLGERWQSPGRQNFPLTTALVLASIAVTVMTGQLGFGQPRMALVRWLQISTPGASFLHEVFTGQVWRLITPIFLHFGLPHLVFDMLMLYVLGAMIEARRGTLVLGALVLVSAVASNIGQYLDTGPKFGGMSGVDYALLGYAWMQSRFNPRAGILVSPLTVMLGLGWLVACMSSKSMDDIANTAHLIGLAVGVVSGYAPILLKR